MAIYSSVKALKSVHTIYCPYYMNTLYQLYEGMGQNGQQISILFFKTYKWP